MPTLPSQQIEKQRKRIEAQEKKIDKIQWYLQHGNPSEGKRGTAEKLLAKLLFANDYIDYLNKLNGTYKRKFKKRKKQIAKRLLTTSRKNLKRQTSFSMTTNNLKT